MIGRIRTAFHKPLCGDGAVRRAVLLGGLATVMARASRAKAPAPPVITLFGDSIAAGYGLSPSEGLAHQLELALASLGVAAVVRNAGVPGDTSAGGRGRLAASVRGDTAVCIVEFGGNDRRLGFPEALTHDSLDAITKVLTARGVSVILVGMGEGERGRVQKQVAAENGVALYPDLFAGVGPDMRQPDRIHPNATGDRVIAQGLAPLVVEALKARGR